MINMKGNIWGDEIAEQVFFGWFLFCQVLSAFLVPDPAWLNRTVEVIKEFHGYLFANVSGNCLFPLFSLNLAGATL